ncbi:hypothetical protein [Natronoflexus pectinivorans]|uniref:YXWGXW repeat-containing protein n=1 Tax=Natronoflexus pectinivorans TaxID=682526 RepID=A0A4R2GGY3_9BACT|nr:hypothetical protein [Natronoflexus pectinivorans]TCO07629.1 hypothetical protein EV194_10713 [Natronoflexus pectinivorans]
MKAIKLTTALVSVMILTSCASTNLTGPGVYYDDIYFVPGSSRENVHQAFSPVPSLTGEDRKNERRDLAIQQNEFERSQRSREQQDLRDFSGIQEEYAAILSDENIQETDTLLYYNEETGYWVDGFRGSASDRNYAERIIRFHGPAIRIPYHSPVYSEIVYFNHYDWNVYVDGHYAYAVPAWHNRWYNSFYFGGWHGRPFGWGMSWHFGSPYYGFGWYDWHSPWFAGHYWHWHRPYFWGGYYRPFYHNPYYAYHRPYNHRPHTTRPVVYQGFRGSLSGDSRGTASVGRSEGLRSTTDRATRTSSDDRMARTSTLDARERSSRVSGNASGAIARGTSGDGELRSTREGSASSSSRRNSETTVRRSYTPTYSQPEGNTRPTYNRATYTRVSNANNTRQTQTTGTVQGASSSTTRQVQQTSRTATQQNTRSVQSAPTRQDIQNTGNRQSGATTRQSAPATYQRGSSSAPQRQSGVQSSPSRTTTPSRSVAPARSSTPSRSVAPSSSSTPSRSVAPSSSSGSSSRSSGGSSSSSSSSSRGGRR